MDKCILRWLLQQRNPPLCQRGLRNSRDLAVFSSFVSSQCTAVMTRKEEETHSTSHTAKHHCMFPYHVSRFPMEHSPTSVRRLQQEGVSFRTCQFHSGQSCEFSSAWIRSTVHCQQQQYVLTELNALGSKNIPAEARENKESKTNNLAKAWFMIFQIAGICGLKISDLVLVIFSINHKDTTDGNSSTFFLHLSMVLDSLNVGTLHSDASI